MRPWLAVCFVLIALRPSSPVHAIAADIAGVTEEQLLLPVTIRGKAYTLDTLIVRPTADGTYPLAIIAQGSSSPQFGPKDFRPEGLRTFAHDFAHRGWVAAIVLWRGYGTSSGDVMNDAGTCTAPQVGRYLNDHADDLQAAMESLARLPHVDPTKRAIAMGLSIGGVSALALAGRATIPAIGAVINVSGGVYHNARPFQPDPACGLFYDDLVTEIGRRGAAAAAHSKIPTLWLYAANDPWFSPTLVQHMLSAYRMAGGSGELTMFPPFEDDGHKIMLRESGRRMLLPEIDRFLRANALPTWDERPWAALLATLGETERVAVLDYLRAGPTEKALAFGRDRKGAYWYSGEATLNAAREAALDWCRKNTGDGCVLAAEDFRLVPAAGNGSSPPANREASGASERASAPTR